MPKYRPEVFPTPVTQAKLDDWDRYGYPKIFINYRNYREESPSSYHDDAYAALLLDDYLSDWFGAAAIFRATRSIPRTKEFPTLLRTAVAKCSVFLPIIGVDWKESLPNHLWVVDEFKAAADLGKVVLPIILARETPLHLVNETENNHYTPVSSMEGMPFGSRNTRADAFDIACEIVSHVPDIQLIDSRAQRPAKDLAVSFSH